MRRGGREEERSRGKGREWRRRREQRRRGEEDMIKCSVREYRRGQERLRVMGVFNQGCCAERSTF